MNAGHKETAEPAENQDDHHHITDTRTVTTTSPGWNQASDERLSHPHDDAWEHGREQGTQDALQAGYDEGLAVGRTTGLEYGLQLGFMHGVLEALLSVSLDHTNNPTAASHQHHHLPLLTDEIQALLRLIDDFPTPEQLFADSQQPEQHSSLLLFSSSLSSEPKNSRFVPRNDHDHTKKKNNDHEDNNNNSKQPKPSPSSLQSSSLTVTEHLQRIRSRFKRCMVRLGWPHFSLEQVMKEVATLSSSSSQPERTATTTTTSSSALPLERSSDPSASLDW